MNHHAHLVHMANQIARNLVPAGGDVPRSVADHIISFWTPTMRQALIADPTGLDPIAKAAIGLLQNGRPAR